MATQLTSPISKLIFKRRLRPLLLAAIVLFTLTEIIVLSPASVDEGASSLPNVLEPEALEADVGASLAGGIPQNKIPDYTVEQFSYAAVQGDEKQWKLNADKAFMYNDTKLVHGRNILAHLYDPDGKITVVKGEEAKFFMNQKDLEIFGKVRTTFPDGFELKSDYLRYRPGMKRILIPAKYQVTGGGKQNDDQRIRFVSHGMDYDMGGAQIYLAQAVQFTLERIRPKNENTRGVADATVIDSDHCMIYRNTNLAQFSMESSKTEKPRYVHITQPQLFARSRRADINYGNSQILNYLIAYEDVLIKETGNPNSLRYSTSGQADFDTKRDVIVLREFPQVYQDNDTVTGDVVLLHRDTDVVEVEHSNAFSQGK